MKKVSLFLRNIKKGFATNSSSYHSTLIMSDEELEKWENGEIEVNGWSYDEYQDTEYEIDWTSKVIDGVKIHIVCIYGSDY